MIFMKLISLNLWGGRVYDKLQVFLTQKSKDVDVFCFQEMLDESMIIEQELLDMKKAYSGLETNEISNLYSKLRPLLPNFESILAKPHSSGGERNVIFYKRGLEIKEKGELTTAEAIKIDFKGFSFEVGSGLQYIKTGGCTIINFHGVWQGGGKDDTPERLKQSEKIVEFLSKMHGKKILIGDFNLTPMTKSIKIIEDSGLQNLIKINNVQSTRSALYARSSKGKFADYAFVSENVKVNDFEVLQEEVSDHLPLYLDFT